jgi:two-component system chemotaxis sensor kinase CheA
MIINRAAKVMQDCTEVANGHADFGAVMEAARKMVQNNDLDDMNCLRQTFIEEASSFLEACEESLMSLEEVDRRVEALADIFRAYHTVKGSASAIGCKDLAQFAHAAEDCLAAFRKYPERITDEGIRALLQANDAMRVRLRTIEHAPQADEDWDIKTVLATLRQIHSAVENSTDVRKTPHLTAVKSPAEPEPVDTKSHAKPANLALKIDATRVDAVMDMVGELVVIKSQIAASLSHISVDQRLRTLIMQLDKSVRELHERTLSMRMISLRSTFLKLQRSIKDVSHKLGKSVQFEVQGEDTEIDRAMVERIADPLMHLCRNAVDHGLESPEKRLAVHKKEAGTISLKAFRKGELVLIEVADDGHGIDRESVIKKAMDRRLLPPDTNTDALTEQDIFNFLFTPGFSTAERVTDVSGRGVGLDVVKANITAINGTIEVKSTPGQGTLFRLCLPLTTAITDGIVVTVGDHPFILPLEVVIGFFESQAVDVVPLEDGCQLARIKDVHYAFIRLGDYVGIEQDAHGLVILIEALGRKVALQVDRVLGKTQVVLKPIGKSVGSTEGLGGAAVMGNGKVALIIDVAGLAALSERMQQARLEMVSDATDSCQQEA